MLSVYIVTVFHTLSHTVNAVAVTVSFTLSVLHAMMQHWSEFLRSQIDKSTDGVCKGLMGGDVAQWESTGFVIGRLGV